MSPFVVNGDKLDFELGIGFYFLYFGLFLFGFGSFLFQVASPDTAKRFSSADEYVERIHSVTNNSDLTPRLVFILQHVEVGSVVEKEASLYKNALSTGVGSSSQQAAKIFTLRNFFEIKDKSRGVFRIAVFFLFSSGILLTMVPSFIALGRVGRDFSRNYL
ncbi:MAG: hypothetical protein K0M47_22830 [Rhizobium sp.]|nr:hypothetical protein [Rhizobium sp.]